VYTNHLLLQQNIKFDRQNKLMFVQNQKVIRQVELSKADFSNAEFDANTTFSNTKMIGASLVGAKCVGVNFGNVDLTGAVLDRANLASGRPFRNLTVLDEPTRESVRSRSRSPSWASA
jgi:uncharacterized protein YjbI with pentapeptide repeats